jgi:hypothetical protein
MKNAGGDFIEQIPFRSMRRGADVHIEISYPPQLPQGIHHEKVSLCPRLANGPTFREPMETLVGVSCSLRKPQLKVSPKARRAPGTLTTAALVRTAHDVPASQALLMAQVQTQGRTVKNILGAL